MFQQFSEFLAMNITGAGSGVIIGVILLTGIALAAVSGYFLTKWTLELFEKLISRTKTKWDDDLLNPLMLRAISQLTPAIVVNWLLPGLFGTSVSAIKWLTALTSLYILWAAVRIVTIFFDNLYNAFLHRRRFRAYAVKGIFDTFKLIAICIGVIVGLSIIIGKIPCGDYHRSWCLGGSFVADFPGQYSRTCGLCAVHRKQINDAWRLDRG